MLSALSPTVLPSKAQPHPAWWSMAGEGVATRGVVTALLQPHLSLLRLAFKDQAGPGRRKKTADAAPRHLEVSTAGRAERGEGI